MIQEDGNGPDELTSAVVSEKFPILPGDRVAGINVDHNGIPRQVVGKVIEVL